MTAGSSPATQGHNPPRLMVQLALAATMVLWGTSFVASKFLLTHISPITYMALRFALAAAVLIVVVLVAGLPRISARHHGLIALTALAEPVAYFLFEAYGLQRTSATTASLIIATVPLAVMVVARIILGEPIPARGLAAVVVSLAGIGLLVVGAQSTAGASSPAGVALVFGAVVSAAVYITLARKLTQHYSALVITAIQTTYGAVVFGGLWVFQAPAQRVVQLDPIGWAAIVFLALGATIGAFMLYNWALGRERAGTAALYINAIPVVTAVVGWVALGEMITPLQVAGGLMVLAAVWLASRRR